MPEPFLSWFHALLLLLRENDEKALFAILLIEEAGVPLPAPGDLLIMFAGTRVAMGDMGVAEAAIAVTLAVMMGSTILYSVSRKFGHVILYRYGRFVHLDESKLAKVEGWIQRHGPIMVLVGRLTPGLRTPTSIMAGVFEVPFHQFLFFATLSAFIWSGFWLAAGYFFGRKLEPLVRYFHYTGYVVFAAAVVLVVWFVIRRRQDNARRRLASRAGETGGT
jgi:membrane protein DedA with SNARE-associated domain